MIKNENIICISSIDWDFVWQGHQEIMSTFAKNANTVLFIENTGVRTPGFKDISRLVKRAVKWLKSAKGFRRESDNLYVYSPLILPFPFLGIARWINRRIMIQAIRRWMKVMNFRDPIIWTFLPTGIVLDIINNIESKLLVYYCIADFTKLSDRPKKIETTERELITRSDLIFAQGETIKQKCRRLNNNVHIFPFGVNIENFQKFEPSAEKIPLDIRCISKPIIGYVGGIHKHIDFKLLKYLAEARPEWSLVLVGPLQTDLSGLEKLKNVHLLGKKDFHQLPAYIHEFDVCIIPYLISGYTATVYPTKLNEYHALGKPVVSTDLPEVESFNRQNGPLIRIAANNEDFLKMIEDSLRPEGQELREKRIASAQRNSWPLRIEEMSRLIEEELEKKHLEPKDWREKLLRLYKKARIRALKFTAVLAAAYFLVFYTPLVWFIASPLKIIQSPQPAEAIVALAGGVGESGSPSQGYEERVQYAVDLYNRGYARQIIFSSGYKYIYQEPMVMKALAVSLGVPPGAITLEDESSHTYDQVEFIKNMMQKRNWHSALLVSSPYHMLRVSLVAKKTAPGIKFVYTPIPQSRFYGYDVNVKRKFIGRQVTLRQIRALLHEYAAILYYLWKGYI